MARNPVQFQKEALAGCGLWQNSHTCSASHEQPIEPLHLAAHGMTKGSVMARRKSRTEAAQGGSQPGSQSPVRITLR
jgi:hypothetical protein